jgi:hypothetical protein
MFTFEIPSPIETQSSPVNLPMLTASNVAFISKISTKERVGHPEPYSFNDIA